jgi:hypothetical protein
MRILVLNADYPRFLAWFYRRQAGLESTSYATQMAARNASLFGVADFYSKNFGAGPPRGGDSRQQSMAPGRLGTRTRRGVRSPRRYRPQGAPGHVSARISQFAGCANLALQWAEDQQARAGSNWVDRFRSVRLQKPRVVRLAEHLEMLNHACKQGREFGLDRT